MIWRREKLSWVFLFFSLFLFLLCFIPRWSLLDFKSQYLEAIKSKGEKRLSLARRALRLNPLYPHTHLLLASIYMENSARDPRAFPEAMVELRRAVSLGAFRGSIPWEAFKAYLTLWPFLTPQDKKAAARAGKFALYRMDSKRLREILMLWSRFCRDFDFIFSVFKNRPGYMSSLARVIYRKGMPLQWRWRALTEYERWLLKKASYRDPSLMGPEEIRRTLSIMDRIKLYYKLAGESFQVKFYWNFLEKLLYYGALKTGERGFLLRFLKLSQDRDRIKELMARLEERGFFSKRDFASFYLKELFLFKLREFEEMEKEIEEFRAGIKWVKKGEVEDYVRINLLLVDYYYQENLLLRASSLLEELLKMSRSPQVLVRLKRIKDMTGEECRCEAPDFYHENPVSLTVSRTRTFYFSPPVGSRSLELEAKSSGGRGLMQVFIDGKIAGEAYIREKLRIKIPLAGDKDFFRVQVRVLQR